VVAVKDHRLSALALLVLSLTSMLKMNRTSLLWTIALGRLDVLAKLAGGEVPVAEVPSLTGEVPVVDEVDSILDEVVWVVVSVVAVEDGEIGKRYRLTHD
jgi:hypothetical protein